MTLWSRKLGGPGGRRAVRYVLFSHTLSHHLSLFALSDERSGGSETGQCSTDGQITAIATVLLSPGITCMLHNTDRLGDLDVAALLACLDLLSRGNGRTRETLILSGLVMTLLGPVVVWVALPALVMSVGCTVVPGKPPAGPLGPYTWYV